MTSWESIDPEILVKAYEDPIAFVTTILPQLPIELSQNQVRILRTFYDKDKKYTELQLVIGRKGGKTLLVSIIVLYEVYKLLLTKDLHKKYGLIPDAPIYLMCVSTSYEQALGVVFQYISALAQGSWYLSNYIVNITKEEIEFAQRIKVRCQPCSSRSGLGFPTFLNVYDEHAHMLTRSGNAAGDVVYNALQPNLKVFRGDGKSVTISTPAGMDGIFWELFKTGYAEEVKQKCDEQGTQPWRVVFQYSSWETNPTLPYDHPEMQKELKADPRNFEMQFEGLFSSVLQAALEEKQIEECAIGVEIDENLEDKETPRIIVMDPATVGSEYAVAMGHLTDKPKKDLVVVDLVKTFKGSHKHPVDINNVENFTRQLCRNFKIIFIGIDQHQSADTIQRFEKEGLPIHLVNITPKYNMEMYTELFRRVNTIHIIYPNKPEIKEELKFLQKKYAGWGWRIEAARGHNDDIPDAIANLCLLLTQNIGKRAEWAEMVKNEDNKWSDALRKAVEKYFEDYSGCREEREELENIVNMAWEEGYEDARETVGDWIDLSDFASDNSWRD